VGWWSARRAAPPRGSRWEARSAWSERWPSYPGCGVARAHIEASPRSRREAARAVHRCSGTRSSTMISRGGFLGAVLEREDAGHGGAAADRRLKRHRAAVQLDEGAHQGKAEARAAVAGAERMGLEPVEHLVLHVGRDAGPAVGHREHHRILEPLGS